MTKNILTVLVMKLTQLNYLYSVIITDFNPGEIPTSWHIGNTLRVWVFAVDNKHFWMSPVTGRWIDIGGVSQIKKLNSITIKLNIPTVQVLNAIFFLKKHVKFGRMIKIALFKVRSIICFVNTAAVKSFHFAANLSSSHFFTSSYESKRCSASTWPIDAKKW